MNTQIYILGGAQTDFARNWSKEGKGLLAMMNEAVHDALQAVQLDFDELETLKKEQRVGIFVGNFNAQQYANQGHLGALLTEANDVFVGMPAARYEAACASGSAAIDAAGAKIRAGDIDVAVVIGIELMKSVLPETGAGYLGTAAYYEKEAKDIPFPFPKLFGQLVDSLLEKYRLNEAVLMDSLTEIARINYANAKRNPTAQTRSWFMNREHISERQSSYNFSIGGRLCIADCSQITDGAAAVILAGKKYTSEFAKKRARRANNIPQIKGWGMKVAPMRFDRKIKDAEHDPHILPWTKKAVDDAYQMAGVTIDSIDIIETHDCFTSSEYAAISAFGLCAPGDEYKVIDKGIIDFTGSTPVNPSGGLIGAGHPVGATGVRMMLDIYKQVTGTADSYQVEGAKNGLMLNIGGSATTNMVFIVGV